MSDFLTGRPIDPYYRALKRRPDAEYGAVLPFAFNTPGSAAWVQAGSNPRFALPEVARTTARGFLDLLRGTETGSLTPEALETITLGSLGAGTTLVPRGALAAGAARGRRAFSDLPMDVAARFQRARDLEFRPHLKLFHWTDAPDFPAFAWGDGRARSSGLPQAGFWAAEDPKYLEDLARLLGREDGSGGRVIPLVPRFSKPGSMKLSGDETHQDIYFSIRNAWGDGYDAIRLQNYNTFADGTPTPTWIFRDPNQLRSRFARFDPTRRGSDDLMAGFAVPGAAVPGFNVRPRDDSQGLANFRRRAREERVY